MLNAINSHVLTGTSPCFNMAILMQLIHGFAILIETIIGAATKDDITISNVHGSKHINVVSK